MKKVTTILAVIAAPLLFAACEGDRDGFDPNLDCDVNIASGYTAQLNNGETTDRNGDGIFVLCADPGALETIVGN